MFSGPDELVAALIRIFRAIFAGLHILDLFHSILIRSGPFYTLVSHFDSTFLVHTLYIPTVASEVLLLLVHTRVYYIWNSVGHVNRTLMINVTSILLALISLLQRIQKLSSKEPPKHDHQKGHSPRLSPLRDSDSLVVSSPRTRPFHRVQDHTPTPSRIIRDNPIHPLLNRPSHQTRLVHRPHKHPPTRGPRFLQKPPPHPHQHLLINIHRGRAPPQHARRIPQIEADQRGLKPRQVALTKREERGRPAPEDEPFRPRRSRRDGLQRLRKKRDDPFGEITQLISVNIIYSYSVFPCPQRVE